MIKKLEYLIYYMTTYYERKKSWWIYVSKKCLNCGRRQIRKMSGGRNENNNFWLLMLQNNYERERERERISPGTWNKERVKSDR